MKALQLQGKLGMEGVSLASRSIPEPGPGEALVRIRAVSLNARDAGFIEGVYGWDLAQPLVLGSDAVGEIMRLGPGTSRFAVGERVSGIFFQEWISGEVTVESRASSLGGPLDGVFSEYRVFPEQSLVAVPAYLSDAEAAALPCAAVTARQAIVEEGRVKAGDTVVVQGTGGVAVFALQLAKLQGARVIVLSSREDKLQRARELGADEGINYREHPEWEREVLRLTGGRGADHVLDVGGADTLNRSVESLRQGGRISLVGLLSGGAVEGFRIVPAIQHRARLQAVSVGSRDMFEAMIRALEQHRLRPAIDRVYPLERYEEAFARLTAGEHVGKIVLEQHRLRPLPSTAASEADKAAKKATKKLLRRKIALP
ncbi:zinc-binding dehydrogenase [Paenibacillus sp. B01]|nr:zinc-binding dehydrogenase [Paenibacillus sp. B01]